MNAPLVLGGATVAVGLAAHGAFYRNSALFGAALGRLPTDRREVALTFDDGPNPDATPPILDALAQAGVHATFFILGRHAERWPALVRRVHDEGHAIGNHGYYHRKLHFKGPRYVRHDLGRGADAIAQACGARPALFRAPHGFRSPWVNAIARSMGERVIGWSLGVWDSDRPGVDEIVHRTLAGARPGSILLLHDGDGYDPAGDRRQTAGAVPRIVGQLAARGYAFVPVPAA
ncbi:MAG: polysaccharide deacetylase family protein [Gemmatimonadota bacterium]|nr:polysaccharide deacetylase family protein [Gemmatimonadota bacterium]MDE3127414.1 polysaccharide deacetylase family protein [Gemmatimonadota bacterium]MDE3171865.1 polysaccharide deacetylase family protein [Gemmatimonadota bacterium]MDE3214815.1 polysaccharide deacetylase family protein [Gemmatimonadota bacterium]